MKTPNLDRLMLHGLNLHILLCDPQYIASAVCSNIPRCDSWNNCFHNSMHGQPQKDKQSMYKTTLHFTDQSVKSLG